MNRTLRIAVAAASFTVLGIAVPAAAQPDPHQHEQGTPPAGGPQGMGGIGMGPGMMGGQGMGGMMGCPMMSGRAMGGGMMGGSMPHLPPGNEKLELQMHADMMKAMGDIMAKYAARLPEKK
jgi:hypothetical protein